RVKKVKVRLRPIVSRLNLPTVIKTAILPGESMESLFIATQVGEIFYVRNRDVRTFLDISSQIIKLGGKRGSDERGLLGLAFHPEFHHNGLFYLHYSVAGTQGPGALTESFTPNPCDPKTLNLKWTNREKQYDHIDTVEEWVVQRNGQPIKSRTLLNLRRPFSNHNGVNSLNFSPESGKLVLTTGDGGSGYDPFNLSQDNLEIAGKIIEIDVRKNTSITNPPVVSRFNELPVPIQEMLSVIVKGVRNIPGISFQRYNDRFLKYVGNVGQGLVESIFAFTQYKPIPVTQLTSSSLNTEGFINLGWRGWEGAFPTTIINDCSSNPNLKEQTIAYYNEAVNTSVKRHPPLISYFHQDARQDKFSGTAITGVKPYLGNTISDLTGSVIFIDLANRNQSPAKGVLAYTRITPDNTLSDYSVIETDYNFGDKPAFYVSPGTNLDQTRLFLGVNGSMKVTEYNQGTVFEVIS